MNMNEAREIVGDAEVIVSVEMHGNRPTVKIVTARPMEVKVIEWYDNPVGADVKVHSKEFGDFHVTTVEPPRITNMPYEIETALLEFNKQAA